ncbi:hypothetical protein NM208_g4607 [Fusarium decemcellulare]|uniref:Uncharacterized protein n=1 Tax=Fusarium decemcellulare TaxID=57161 RepID=A0ACC1SK47_9HYPO|nr:hypothetical protein NM208_g4607 [Fusarium decemcellulare]
MLAHLSTQACLLAVGLASVNTAFHLPHTKPFLSVDFLAGWPSNVTTPNALVAMTPNAGGNVTGAVTGTLVGNVSSSTETFLHLNETDKAVSEYVNQFIFVDESGNGFLVKMSGFATYGDGAIHGFAHVNLQTGKHKMEWVNYAMFIGEWTGAMDSGTGLAKLDIFKVSSGGLREKTKN